MSTLIEAREALRVAQADRDRTILEQRQAGWTLLRIAKAHELSLQRVAQILARISQIG